MNRLEVFNEYRPLLFSIAYNMLGSIMDAEDMVQETFLRWQAAQGTIETPKSYLATIITRLCINQLDSAKAKREEYLGPWLPEPVVTEFARTPEQSTTMADTLSMAFLFLLENLTSDERAVYLLRKVFDYDYAEIADMVDKSEANCRQIVSRVQRRITAGRPHIESVSIKVQEKLAGELLQACLMGDVQTAMALMADDIVLRTDGGGQTTAAIYPISGAERVAQYLVGVAKKAPEGYVTRFVQVNGQLGVMGETLGKPIHVMTFEFANGRIQSILNVANPQKLTRIPECKENNS